MKIGYKYVSTRGNIEKCIQVHALRGCLEIPRIWDFAL